MHSLRYPLNPILAIDDEEDVLNSYRIVLRMHGINNFRCCSDCREVMALMAENSFSVVILDLTMPHLSGKTILDQIKENHPELPVIVVTGSDDVSTAVDCMKAGAYDYMVKPVEEARLAAGLRNALEMRKLQRENRDLHRRFLSRRLKHPDAFARFITVSESMKAVFQYIEAIAAGPRPVLITGESGVGKEIIARAVHDVGGRTGVFVPVNVAGLDDTTFSDTLFGHRKGAYTGADSDRRGLVEKAGGGTLFLDEIGNLENTSQVKLLRLLQEHEFYQLGSDIQKQADTNIVAATNQDLKAGMEAGTFRADLYFRLATHHIQIPPLRERVEDIPFLVQHFLKEASETLGISPRETPDDLYPLLSGYPFPGNVRELESMVFDIAARSTGTELDIQLFKEHIRRQIGTESETASGDLNSGSISYLGQFPRLRKVEKYFIAEAMRKSGGNQSAAARLLGISQSTLSRRFKE